jgi:hypothetical protein
LGQERVYFDFFIGVNLNEALRDFVGRHEEKKQLGRPRRNGSTILKQILEFEGVDWIYVTQERYCTSDWPL